MGRAALAQVLVGLAVLGPDCRNDPLTGSVVEQDGSCFLQVVRMLGGTEVPAGVVGNAAEGILAEDTLVGCTQAAVARSLVEDILAGCNQAVVARNLAGDTLVECTQVAVVGSLVGGILVEGNLAGDTLVEGHGPGGGCRNGDVPF